MHVLQSQLYTFLTMDDVVKDWTRAIIYLYNIVMELKPVNWMCNWMGLDIYVK